MIRSTLFLVPALFLAACAQQPEESADSHGGSDSPAVTGEAADPSAASATDANATTYGTPPADGTSALTPAELVAQAEALDGQTVLVEGTVTEVCQMAGCWLKLENEAGEDIRVNVAKDAAGEYVYTFPMTMAGGTRLVLGGTLAVEETPVETLRHLAEDGGQTPEQVAAITAPKREVILTATGARVLAPAAQS